MKTKKRLLSALLSLVLMLGLMPGMSLTAYAAPTETLLTTITATGKEQANYSTANVATVSFSYTAGGSSAYFANWGWWGYGWTATVAPANGYTITKCVFYDDANRTATDSEAPFVVETTEEDKTPQVNGTPILAYMSKGIKKIEVYGYATPAHTHDFTYSASGATITATCANTDGNCTLDDGTAQHNHAVTLTLSATDANYTGSAYTGASLSNTTAWTGAGLTAPTIEYAGRGSTSYTKSTTAPTNAGTYTASITVDTDKTATVDFTISPIALTIDTATATDRAYDKDSIAVTISGVTFKNGSTSVALTKDTDYTVTGAMSDVNAGNGKTVNVTVTLTNSNYSLATNTATTTVNISKADAQTIADVTGSQLYTLTSVSASVAGNMPEDAGTLSYTAGTASKTGSVTVSDFAVDANGNVTATLSGGAAGDTITLPVTIGSTNYANSTVNVMITLTAKDDAGVSISGVPTSALTYGDADFTLTGSVTAAGTGTGTWTWSSSDDTVFQITPNGATATVKILKAGSATITASYESDTTIGNQATAAITVNTKTVTIQAKDQGIYVGGEIPSLVGTDFYTVTGLVGEETLTTNPTLVYQQGGSKVTPDNTTAGTYDIVPSGAAASDNYSISYTNGTLTISSKGTQTITAENVTVTYGDTGKKIEASTTGDGGLSYAVKSGDAVTVDASGNLTIVKAGSAVITVTAAETDTYAQATKDVNVTVNTKAMTVSAEDVNVTVDGQAHGITVTVTDPASGATVKYGTEAGSYTLDASPTQTEVGEKTVYYQVTADNYTTYTGSAKVTITALPTYEVIYKVVNGTWSDDSTTDKKETVQSGSTPASVPTGMKAASGYTGGAWDTDPAGATITEATTFTYTFTAIPIYTVTVTNDGHGTGSAAPVSGAEGTEVTLNATPAEGYAFKEWQVVSGSVTVKDNKFTIGTANVEIKAVFEQAGDMEDEVIVEPGAPAVSGTNIDEVAAGVVTADEVAAGVKVWVDISPLAEAAVPAGDKALANQAMQGFGGTAGAWIDMSMFKQVAGQSKTAVHQTATAFRFSMKVPDSLKKAGRTFWLLRLHDDKADILATTTGDTLSGETDLFSTYLIAYKDAETPTPTPKPVPKTGDQDHPGLWIILMLIGIAGLTVIGTLKVSRKRK